MDSLPFLSEFDLNLFFKLPLLLLIFLYALFALVLVNKIKSLGKIVYISSFGSSALLELLAFVHLAGSISLFFIALVIL